MKVIASDSTHLGQYLDGGSLIEAAVDDFALYEEVNTSSLNDLIISDVNRRLLKITDVLGRQVDITAIKEKTTLFYIYDNGTVERKLIIE